MDALYAPLQAVESARSPQPALDRLAAALHGPVRAASTLRLDLDQAKREIDDLLKGYHKAITKLGSAIDKTVPHHPTLLIPERFTSPTERAALDRAVSHALVRLGQRSALECFARESAVGRGEMEDVAMGDDEADVGQQAQDPTQTRAHPLSPLALPALLSHVERLESVVCSLHAGDLGPALAWAAADLPPEAATAELRFALHKAAFLTLLGGGEPFPMIGSSSSGASGGSTCQARALAYARAHLTSFYGADSSNGSGGSEIQHRYRSEIHRLLGALVVQPSSHPTTTSAGAAASGPLDSSPYADLHLPPSRSLGPALEPLIRRAFALAFGLAQSPALDRALRAGLDGGVARVEKARAVLAIGGVGVGAGAKASGVGAPAAATSTSGGTDTTASNSAESELPVEIPLEPVDRHHSVFVCPVSKELALPSSAALGGGEGSTSTSAAGDDPAGVGAGRRLFYSYGTHSGLSYLPSPGPSTTTPSQQAGSAAGNPAVMLKCGHTVVRESLKRLPKGSSAASRAAAAAAGGGRAVKCAYCPMETPAGKELELHF